MYDNNTPSSLLNTYKRLPIAFASGQGSFLLDDQGEKYLDAISGISVTSLGHCHPQVVEAIQIQASKLIHTSNLFHIPLQNSLAERLTQQTGTDGVFFCNSGAEANETALKIARMRGNAKNIQYPRIIVCDQAFHGRTLATISATGNTNIQNGFPPLLPGFIPLPYNDAAQIDQLSDNKEVVAVLLEPVLGEGGVIIPSSNYLSEVQAICRKNDWLFIVDEIQTGLGRTGSFLACDQSNVQPDIITLAKSLGNGVPIGACLTRGDASTILKPGTHGSTFGGNPLACAAAHAVLDVLLTPNFIEKSIETANFIVSSLRKALKDAPSLVAIRHKGLMIGIELNVDAKHLPQLALQEEKLLINVTHDKIIRLLPPLNFSEAEASWLVSSLATLIEKHL